jgi:hypothetical protein
MLTKKEIKSFKRLYKKKFGVSLSSKQAVIKGVSLIILLQEVYGPLNNENYQKLQLQENGTNTQKV